MLKKIQIDPTAEKYEKIYSVETNSLSVFKQCFKFLLFLLWIILTGGILAIISLFIIGGGTREAYAIIVDAGSTSSKISVLKWLDRPFHKNEWVEELNYTRTEPGISAYTANPSEASERLVPIITEALSYNVPLKKVPQTSLYLAATAGMRLLDLNHPLKAIKIMDILRQTLPNLNATVHNIFSDIRIISGNTEGRYGWVAANYLDKKLGDPSGSPPESEEEMMGMLDLGGASTQIAFVPENGQPAPHTLSLNLFGATYDVYSYSFLCFGKEAFITRYLAMQIAQMANITEGKIYSPCHLVGYQEKIDTGEIFAPPCVTTEVAEELTGLEIVPPEDLQQSMTLLGTGQPTKCRAEISRLFPTRACSYDSCSFMNVSQPLLRGKFFAFSGFAYAIEFFEFPTGGSNLTRTQVQQAVDLFCQRKWSEVENEHPSNELQYVAGYCFAGIYIDSLLNGYGFSEDLSWKNINFVKEIANTSASWALGYMVDATGQIESLPSENDLYELLLAVSMIVLCLAWFLTLISLLFTS